MKRLWLIGLFFFVNNVFAQELITKVIQLQYIPAEKVIKLMEPLMPEGQALSGTGQTLVTKVDAKTLTQLRTILHQIDVPPVTFNVFVYQGDPQWLSAQNDNSVTYSTQTQSQMLQSQSVRVMNGESALVTMNQEVPIVTSVGAGFYGSGVSYEQHQIKNGILVQPVLRGSQVELSVRRLREQMNPAGGQQFDNQKIDTKLMIPLNKWVSLGSPEGAQQTDNSSRSFSAGNTFAQQSALYIKVTIMGQNPAAPKKNTNAVDTW
ncbi:type II/III secretion system protein [Legionella lytica]|uniref:Type II/III secretion system protein n=1 Tax=Legionella lytica TaxID=96232 RepID=A0ABW8DBV3_9GAMM